MALTIPAGSQAQVICLPFPCCRQIAATTTDAFTLKPGFKGRVVGASASVGLIGGTTEATDVDIMFEKTATDILAAQIAAVQSSAVVSGGALGTLSTTSADLAFTATDIFHMDVTLTGGSSPTVDDVMGFLFVVRE